ncbi:N-methyl-L-tryptophan oxidase [Lichenifustis flavocetrariae]|uniref:N-methyl-L-tryptophan oxidase n=1 Tax=Lichenifustis flavocetrariae TaxID=2949735 RepID=A0AA41YZJ7_9HYPH|nr:N-methyl-L-tryptophan oxidase [Lichenifustis flavocetrariae]MCW6510196.1 N-methyl-L-tryptophan oxidase [Lichenifustis flavocetrariae]
MSDSFDVAVIGLGAMGSAAVAHLASRGCRVVGLEAHYPAHALSSSHGDSRLIRLGYFEDPSYVPLLRRAYQNWRMLERQVRETLLTVTGVLEMGRPDSTIVSGARAACELHGLPFQILDPDQVQARYPVFALDDDDVGLFEPEGGYLRPERAVMAHLKVAGQAGAVLRFGEAVAAIEPDDAGVTIVSAFERLRARTVIVATGPWIAQLVPQLRGIAQPIRQVVAWYQPADAFVTLPERMPVFLRDEGAAGSYFGFPSIGTDGFKVGKHAHFHEPIDPNLPNPPVNDTDTALLDGFAHRRLPGAAGVRAGSTTCRYTMLPGEDFLMDLHPSEKRVIVASPCSGHGFKFASVAGEILADLATQGGTALPIELFSFAALEQKRRTSRVD